MSAAHSQPAPAAWPKAPVWERLLAEAGRTDVAVVAPVAPAGVARRDPFNPRGKPSWFRYSTDHSGEVPQRFDPPNPQDLAAVLGGPGSLTEVLQRAASGAGGARNVALVGESQGGVVAAALAMRWNTANPHDQLGAVGLLRTAVDPCAWVQGVPVSRSTVFHVVLGASDTTFRPEFSLRSLQPLLDGEPPAADVRVHVLPAVGHADSNRVVYRRYVQLLTEEWPGGTEPGA